MRSMAGTIFFLGFTFNFAVLGNFFICSKKKKDSGSITDIVIGTKKCLPLISLPQLIGRQFLPVGVKIQLSNNYLQPDRCTPMLHTSKSRAVENEFILFQ